MSSIMHGNIVANRSGRVISLCRLALSVVFLLAVWIDPTQPASRPGLGYFVLLSYIVFSAAVLVCTWNNWWADWQLAWPSHIVDISIFAVMVYLTDGYTSPFFTLFVFLLFSATIRWNWRVTAYTAGGVALAFFVAGALSLESGAGEFDLQRSILRTSYLVVVSGLFIWFGEYLQSAHASTAREIPDDVVSVRDMLEHLLEDTRAESLSVMWWENDEPWIHCGSMRGGKYDYARHDPATLRDFIEVAEHMSGLLGDAKNSIEWVGQGDRPTISDPGVAKNLAQVLRLNRFVAAPFDTTEIGGWIVLDDVPGLSIEEFDTARAFAATMARFFERESRERAVTEQALSVSRATLARDLHDSVVQIVAGVSFRLEAIRRQASRNEEIGDEIDRLQAELGSEQKDLRKLIGRLRGAGPNVDESDFHTLLGETVDRVCRQWGVACEIDFGNDRIEIPQPMARHVALMLREGAANAVKHGGAREIGVRCAIADGQLRFSMREDGTGFDSAYLAEDGRQVARLPFSLSERISQLGGTLDIAQADPGTLTTITLPLDTET